MRTAFRRMLLGCVVLTMATWVAGCAQYVEPGAQVSSDIQSPANRPASTAALQYAPVSLSEVLDMDDRHITYDGNRLKVDAQVSSPAALAAIPIMEVTYGGIEADFEALRARLLPGISVDSRTFTATEQFDRSVDMQIASRYDETGVLYVGGLMSYPGYFGYMDSLPDEVYRKEREVAEYGRYSPDGVARQCAITADTALDWAEDMLELTGVDAHVRLCAPQVYAVSPEPDTRLFCGYYVVYYPLEVNGIPVSVSNPSPDDSSLEPWYMPLTTGFRFQCFDVGIMEAEGYWLDMEHAERVAEYTEIISPLNAVAIADAASAEDYWVQVRDAQVMIREIRLEYAVIQQDGCFRLVPAWTLDTCEGVALDRLRGIRIDATTGEVLALELSTI